jgi:hypothetical protein
MLYTSKFKKDGASFETAEEANADRIAGLSAAIIEEAASVDASLIASGVLAAEETYTWDSAENTLTITRDVSDIAAFFAARDAVSAKILQKSAENGWIRTKEMTQ